MAVPGQTARPVLVCGETRTCLLPSFQALDGRAAAQLLRLRADEQVSVSERPNLYALSPEALTGVDCRLPTANGAKVRAVGTVASRAALTEGRVLQATAYFSVPAAGPDTRRPWGHYLVRPGLVEPFGKLPAQATAEGVLRGSTRGELDLGMIAEGLLAQLLRHPLLDHKAPFKSRRTHLRWVVRRTPGGEGPSLERFTLAEEGLRTVELRLPEEIPAAAAAGVCEDLARHDWLLTTLVHMLDNSRLGAVDGPSAVLALRPAVDHLLHLWMPRAHVERTLSHLWDVLEREPGFTRQWQTLVQRIRDQLAVQAIPLLHEALSTR
ncbi:SCO2521 family protein [Streptomyces chiangmaiensis]|uniref:SCO2521 family protein n=1 Tax=Streptomyces chiangmaiensis TaxID=766497 RepID=A0ABU7FKE5_9ACTN|nr:SCO2521 family protein [Streptomyces chiangmaiensis]MED7824419.1 SCO2521 family protein [Streptomyces chiangmaiensis]